MVADYATWKTKKEEAEASSFFLMKIRGEA
jgi:hypothetical protein